MILSSTTPLNSSRDHYPSSNDTLCQRIRLVYERWIICVTDWLNERVGSGTSIAVGTLFLEPLSVLRATIDWIWHGISKTPHFSGVNPTKLTKKQRQLTPVLCLHGNYHSPTAFTGIAHSLKDFPLFTVRLNNGDISDGDYQRIEKKIDEIQTLYGNREIKIDLIGHSRGALIAQQIFDSNTIRKAILLGYDHEPQNNHIHVINGTRDYLLKNPPESSVWIKAGHLGILYSSETYQYIKATLSQ